VAGIQKFSEQVIEYAERLSDMADAAEGRQHRRSAAKVTRWVLLPASGAALFALVRSNYFARQAKEVVDEAKSRASELPDDLISRVRLAANGATNAGRSSGRRSAASARRTSTRKSSPKRTTSRAR
jgi:hypothetical protein